ncbi:MAG: hypothetical protein ABI633_13310 [Burkholderiales bacterium]
MESEDVGYRLIELALLPAKQIAARRGFQPASQTYNRAVLHHEFNCTAAISDKKTWTPDVRRVAIVIGPGEAAPVDAAMIAGAQAVAGILVTHRHSEQRAGTTASSVAARHAAGSAPFDALATTLEWKDNTR